MRVAVLMFLLFATALIGGLCIGSAAAVSPSVQSCVIKATRTAVASRHNRAALGSLYDRYLGDPFARQAAKAGNWDKFSPKEKALQRAWARERTLAAVPRFLAYASAAIEVQRESGNIVYGKATLPGQGSSSLVWYLAGGGCRFYDLRAGGYLLSQLVGNYQTGKRKK